MGLHEQRADPETHPRPPQPLMESSKLSLASPQRLVYCLSYILLSELYPSVAPSLFANNGRLKVALPRVQRA